MLVQIFRNETNIWYLIKRDWPRWNLSACTTQFEEGVEQGERERSLGSGSSPSLWVHVTGSCEERQSSQLLPSLEVTQNLASGAREGWAGAFSAASTSALRVDGWMLVWRTLLQRRCTWAAGNEPKLKCQNPWTREFVKGGQGVFSEVERQCRDQKVYKLEIQEAPSQSTGTTPKPKKTNKNKQKFAFWKFQKILWERHHWNQYRNVFCKCVKQAIFLLHKHFEFQNLLIPGCDQLRASFSLTSSFSWAWVWTFGIQTGRIQFWGLIDRLASKWEALSV